MFSNHDFSLYLGVAMGRGACTCLREGWGARERTASQMRSSYLLVLDSNRNSIHPSCASGRLPEVHFFGAKPFSWQNGKTDTHTRKAPLCMQKAPISEPGTKQELSKQVLLSLLTEETGRPLVKEVWLLGQSD